MALTTACMSWARGRPPHLAGGIDGATSLHWASVRSDGYGFRSIPYLSAFYGLLKQVLRPFAVYSGAMIPIRRCLPISPRTVWSDKGLRHKWSLSAPQWAVFVFVGFYPVLVFPWELVRRSRRLRNKRCIDCGYDLTGNVSRRCPECGEMHWQNYEA